MDNVGFGGGASEQKSIFVWNGPKGPRGAQKGPKWSKTLRLTILVPFGPFWTTLERWQACHVWPFLVQNGPFLGHPQSWTVDPKVKKGSSPGLLCVACLWNPKISRLEHKYGRNRWKMSKAGQNSMTKWPFFAIILPWMASYGSEISFLLVFSARDDLVKVSWKSDAQKCQNQVTPLTLTSWVKVPSPFVINASGAIWWPNLEPMKVAPSNDQIYNQLCLIATNQSNTTEINFELF